MFLNDMNIGEAVKYENGIYAVALGGGTFEVNGNIIECKDGEIRVVEVSDINSINKFGGDTKVSKRKAKTEKVISHYINVDTKEETDIKKFTVVKNMFDNIHEKCFNRNRGMIEFKTMEDEYNYKLLENEVNKYKPVYTDSSENVDDLKVSEKQSMKEKLQVTLIGYFNKSDTKYIETSIRHGKAMYGKELGTYRFHASQYIHDYLEYVATSQKLELSYPTNIDDVKGITVNGIQLFSDVDLDNLDFLKSPYTYHLDIDDAKDMLSFANKKIDLSIRLVLNGILDKAERLKTVNTLDKVIATMSKKRATASDAKNIITIVEQLKSTLVSSTMQ